MKAAHSVTFPALQLSSETTRVTPAFRNRRAGLARIHTRPPRGRKRSQMVLLREALFFFIKPKRQ